MKKKSSLALGRSLTKKQLHFAALVGALLLGAVVHSGNCFDHTEDTVDFPGPDVHPGYPDAFHFHYVLPKDTVSPNGKYGVIFPDRTLGEAKNDSLHDFVVSLDPEQILTELKADWPEFEGKNHGGYEVEWAADSSVALVTLEAKWGPGEFVLIEFEDGKVSRMTNLDKRIRQLIEPDFRKSKVEPYNDSFGFIYEYQEESPTAFCRLENSALVKIDAYVTNDPKAENPWRVRLRATWDIHNAKFTQQRLTRLTNNSKE